MDAEPPEHPDFQEPAVAKRDFREALEASPSRPDAKAVRGDNDDRDPDGGTTQSSPSASREISTR